MSRTDLIADTFAMITNAIMAKREDLDAPASNTVKAIMDVLKKEGYIENFKLIDDKKQGLVKIYLKYIAGKSVIKKLKRISKPGLRVYAKRNKVPTVLRGRGIAIISTSKGIMTDKEARELGVGGEIIGYVW
jgi:small subunit ribosomal protein S8